MTSIRNSIRYAIRRFFERLGADQTGNILMMMGLALIPVTFSIGFGIDYSRAQNLQTQLTAAADAAALAAVDPAMLCQSSTTASAAATAMFQAQANALPGIASFTANYNPQVTINPVNAAAGCTGTLRTATVTYKANAKNLFSAILGVTTLPITGTATASAAQPPSMNFTIAMDTSPSMLLPTTSQGIANLKAETKWVQYGQGCTFACHSNNMQAWHNGMFVIDANKYPIYLNNTTTTGLLWFFRVACASPYNVYDSANNLIGKTASVGTTLTGCQGTNSNPTSPPNNNLTLTYTPTGASRSTTVSVSYPDSWWLAQNYDAVNPGQSQVQLRIDAETLAAQNLITYAYNVEQQYASSGSPPIYKLQYFTFNVYNPAPLATSPFNAMTDVATLQSSASSFPDLGASAPLMSGDSYWILSSQNTNNYDTDFSGSLTWLQANALPASSGTGTRTSPQNVLVIITDGMDDAFNGSNEGALNSSEISKCTAIKATGTRIAILYTTYDPATINYSPYTTFTNIANNLVPSIQGQLQACASQNPDGSYLMTQVSTNGDISAALNALFQQAVQTARLVQ